MTCEDARRKIVLGAAQPGAQAVVFERALLQHLGHTIPAQLTTVVTFRTRGVRCRRCPALEGDGRHVWVARVTARLCSAIRWLSSLLAKVVTVDGLAEGWA